MDLDKFLTKYSDSEEPVAYSTLKNGVPVAVAVGTYTVEAYNCDLAAGETGKGQLRLYDSEQVTVNANAKAEVELECTAYSSELVLKYSDAYKAKYTEASQFKSIFNISGFTRPDGVTSMTLVENESVFFNSTPDNSRTIQYELKANGETSSAQSKDLFTGDLTLDHACKLTVEVGIQSSTGQLTVTLTADDTLSGKTTKLTIDPYTGEVTSESSSDN